MFKGTTIQVFALDNGFIELCFDRIGVAINKLDRRTVDELREAITFISTAQDARGVIVTSAKETFIVGADINEFAEMFRLNVHNLSAKIKRSNDVFIAFEDLHVPTVVAINGLALGGGLEMALSASLRVMSSTAQIGLPEVKLGLFPGFGGTVRMPRVAGPAVAIDWIASGKLNKAEAAKAAGVVDEICTPEALREKALALLEQAASGQINWRERQQRKLKPLALPINEISTIFAPAKLKLAGNTAKHQPAALAAIETMELASVRDRAGAQLLECDAFARIAKTQAAGSMIQTYHNEQALKKMFQRHQRDARALQHGAVLGAGIMGGGIAYASALRGTPVLLKDVVQSQLDLGASEARKQLTKQVKAGRLAQEKSDHILSTITPQLDYANFRTVDVVIEAVVENIHVKRSVLLEVEKAVRDDVVIASNTSSLRIDDLAAVMERPENFVGMHFFNPVPVMALVEVIKGSRTSNSTVSTAVGYVLAMGKTPIVVKDCPGFLVNRILTPYVNGFLKLVADGADFLQVDRVMEQFGWPMGPAYLQDVVGMDTGSHVSDMISAGYPQRMTPLVNNAVKLMVQHGRLGQKAGKGFYQYELDPNGKPKKSVSPETAVLLATIQPNGLREFSENEIVERMMLPMIIEAAQALEDGVVATPAELDMAMQLGVGFPQYLGGPLKYASWLGLARVVAMCDKYAYLGPSYQAPSGMRKMVIKSQSYYQS
ncbi:fatty acid oxidation complex subunit alpha FadB [Sapientia aquatica]|uniref:enoyl-CoA hydratase n=1 Tax=Sapientia aquatica TaxID=1549640 RepID=A0A4R5W370_9BURK|nr:fatty acid oxidation complex subunit alpha FadB [Sapientia aquatica]TDK65649.1 fatty acid oxidation complex subunit alpha FadB [Sapientia aquatica]